MSLTVPFLSSLPSAFIKNINETFGQAGRDWLAGLEERLSLSASLWQLTDISPAEPLSFNLVCHTRSGVYGEVVLKTGVLPDETKKEFHTLKAFQGEGTVMPLDYDSALNVLLLEKIIPGNNLFQLSPREQAETGAAILKSLQPSLEDLSRFSPYSSWVSRAFAGVREREPKPSPFHLLMEEAEILLEEILQAGYPETLLHGDFHHMNILKSGVSGWKVIDPQGVLGPRVLDSGRFLRNHLDRIEESDWESAIREWLDIWSRALEAPSCHLMGSALIDYALGTAWNLEREITKEEAEQRKEKAEKRAGIYRTFL